MPMTESEYEGALGRALGEVMDRMNPADYPDGEARKLAGDALNNTWHACIPLSDWVAVALERLGLKR